MYKFKEPIHSQLLCSCRECGYISGKEPNTSVVISEKNFRFTKGKPKTFQIGDLQKRRICFLYANFGTHICVKSPSRPGMLDDHSLFSPRTANYCIDKQSHQHKPNEIQSFERVPQAKP